MTNPPPAPSFYDKRLPHLELVWSPKKMRGFLQTLAVPRLFPREHLRDASVLSMEYHPGRRCVSHHGLLFESGAAAWVVVSFAKDDRLKHTAAEHYGAGTEKQALYLADQRCLIEVFPHDLELPSLARVLQRETFEGLLRPYTAETLEPRILSYRPQTACVIACAPRRALPAFALKVMHGNSAAARLVSVSDVLRARLDDGRFVIPRAYAVESEPTVALMEYMTGDPLAIALLGAADTRRQEAIVTLAAEALHALHGVPAGGLARDRRDLSDLIDYTDRRNDRLLLASPELAARADRLLALLRDWQEAHVPHQVADTLLHGDLKASQFLVEDSRIALVDLDSARQGDPAVDLGNFMADLRREAAWAGQDWRALGGRFLQEYARLAHDPGVVPRALFAEACSLVRMAVRSFRHDLHTFGSSKRSMPDRLLAAAAECVAALPS